MGSRLEKNSNDVRKRIERHTFDGEDGEEYEASKFGGFSDYMRRKKIKLQNLDAEIRSRSDEPPIFRNIVVHVNGYTQPSLSDLHNLVVSHGGGFLQYLDGKTAVTHVIASQLTPKKKVEFAKYRIVKPAWIVDSVKEKRLLPWENYRVVDEGVTQKVLGFNNGQITSQASTQRISYRDQSDTSWYTSQVQDVAQKLNTAPVPDVGAKSSSPKTAEQQTEAGERDIDEARQPTSTELSTDRPSHHDEGHEVMHRVSPPVTLVAAPDNFSNEMSDGNPMARQATRPLTAEEHNAILLQNPHMAKSSTANPDFINQYYRESRLHHLSSWKAELKAQLQARAMESSSQKKKPPRAPGLRRYIMHVDFDSFFAAVSLRKNPHLKEKPVVIAHGSGPGSEIASCNYPARKFGVKNGMWMKHALNLCKDLTVLPYDYKAYEDASKHFYDAILAIDGIVQSISIDEALIDVSDQCIAAGGSDGKSMSEGSVYREQAKAKQLAEELRATIRDKTQCEVSVGIGNNILLAKIALRRAKPASQYLIVPEEVLDFLGDLLVTELPGVAHSIGNKLEDIGVKYVKDIRALNKEKLINTLGPKTGEKLWDYSRGIDKQEVGEQVVRKSVSAEVNWGIRFINQQQAEDFVHSLCEELSKRLLEQLVKGKQLTMKIMRKAADAGLDPPKNLGHGKCDTFNKSIVLGVATTDKSILGREAVSILRSYGFPPGELRGLGVQMQKLEPLKPTASIVPAQVDSSQRRLQFKKPGQEARSPETTTTSIMIDTAVLGGSEEVVIPARQKSPLVTSLKAPDAIEEVPTPQKQRLRSAPDSAIKTQHAGEAPLNIGGTQFVIPSQIDPSVLAELPPELQSKLVPKMKGHLEHAEYDNSPERESRSHSASPFVSDSELALPNQSQLDPETLAALPQDVREELMAEYRRAGKTATARLQQVLPQSPRKPKATSSKKVNTTPTKRRKATSLLTKGRPKSGASSLPTLTQSNFVAFPKQGDKSTMKDDIIQDEEVSESFLLELPEDIRQEILDEQRRKRLKNKSGLNVSSSKRRPKMTTANDAARGQQKLFLPRQPSKPTFTSRKLSDLADLRDAMSAWVQEFSCEDEEGPYPEDTVALATYLQRVVLEECDIAKVRAVVNWLQYVIDDWPFNRPAVRSSWLHALDVVKDQVQAAVKQRGLPTLQFSH